MWQNPTANSSTLFLNARLSRKIARQRKSPRPAVNLLQRMFRRGVEVGFARRRGWGSRFRRPRSPGSPLPSGRGRSRRDRGSLRRAARLSPPADQQADIDQRRPVLPARKADVIGKRGLHHPRGHFLRGPIQIGSVQPDPPRVEHRLGVRMVDVVQQFAERRDVHADVMVILNAEHETIIGDIPRRIRGCRDSFHPFGG